MQTDSLRAVSADANVVILPVMTGGGVPFGRNSNHIRPSRHVLLMYWHCQLEVTVKVGLYKLVSKMFLICSLSLIDKVDGELTWVELAASRFGQIHCNDPVALLLAYNGKHVFLVVDRLFQLKLKKEVLPALHVDGCR